MIIEKILGNLGNNIKTEKSVDKVVLDHFDMAKPHQKLKTVGGKVFGLSLPKGEVLSSGDIIFEDANEMVVIDMAEEDIIEIRPKDNMEWGRAAFNIGNMHQSAYIYDNCIRIPYDYVMESLLNNLGVEIERITGKLDGVKANVSIKEHGHGGGHSHSHGEHIHSHGSHSHSHSGHTHNHSSGGHSHE